MSAISHRLSIERDNALVFPSQLISTADLLKAFLKIPPDSKISFEKEVDQWETPTVDAHFADPIPSVL